MPSNRWALWVCLVAGLTGSRLPAWNAHEKLTRWSSRSLFETRKDVEFVPLQDALSHGLTIIKARHRREFLRQLKIQKDYGFPLKLGENLKTPLAALAVMSKYSEEPDWGMDQDLFAPDQYPELWTKDSPYVTGKTGFKSQGFRHMYFPGKFLWKEPIASIQVPMRPLGEAPDRAALFYDLAGDCLNRGETYWGYRFLGFAIHYVEDLFVPYHTRQAPSKRFWVWKWSSFLPSLDVDATAEQITYYHLSYEKWVESQLGDEKSPLLQRLQHVEEAPDPHTGLREYIIDEVVKFSGARATRVGKLSYRIFPKFNPSGGVKVEDFVNSSEWQKQIVAGPDQEALLEVTGELFEKMGGVVRRLVTHLHAEAPPKKAAKK